MTRRGRTVGDAEAEVVRLEQAAAQWRAESETKRIELRQLQDNLGDQVLEGADARRLHATAEDLRILIAGADAAAESADRKLRTARAEVFRARAADVRQQAEAAHRTADAHQSRVEKLLDQLEEVDGVRYGWKEPEYPQPGQSWTVPRGDVLRMEADRLTEQADALDAQAAAIEQGAVGALI